MKIIQSYIQFQSFQRGAEFRVVNSKKCEVSLESLTLKTLNILHTGNFNAMSDQQNQILVIGLIDQMILVNIFQLNEKILLKNFLIVH